MAPWQATLTSAARPDNGEQRPLQPEPPVLFGLRLPGSDEPDFDGQTLEVKHVTSDSTACLDVSYGTAANGQDVQTWDCNNSQTPRSGPWRSGPQAITRASTGLSAPWATTAWTTAATSPPVTGWASGAASTTPDGAAANQSVTIAASGSGYTLTFANGSSSVWLTTDRTSTNPRGGAKPDHRQRKRRFERRLADWRHTRSSATASPTAGTAAG